jgi:cysteinyl-tRNA synthetase
MESKGCRRFRPETAAMVSKALADFESSMDDDFNTAAALAAIHDMVREINILDRRW